VQTSGSPIQKIDLSALGLETTIQLSVLREDLNYPLIKGGEFVLGNKWRKLKYNIQHVLDQRFKGILTFGGAYSNHLYAVAAAGKAFGFKTIGVVRGKEWQHKTNPTLQFCTQRGMQLIFWDRSTYRNKEDDIESLQQEFADYWIVPEGGSNALALKGVQEIWNLDLTGFSTIAVPVGTGGTLSGLILGSLSKAYLLGFSALKFDLNPTIETILKANDYTFSNWGINNQYHFGGFARYTDELLHFMRQFKSTYHIALEPLYTAKMMYGIFDGIEKGIYETNTHILAVHTGGLQGLAGFEARYGVKC